MGMFDYFVGPLKCPWCRATSSDASTNMQTKIRKDPVLESLGVGTVLNSESISDWEDIYIELQKPSSANLVRLLTTWPCPVCEQGSCNWAEVTVKNGIISAVSAVILNPHTINQAHYIDHDCCDYLFDEDIRQQAGMSEANKKRWLEHLNQIYRLPGAEIKKRLIEEYGHYRQFVEPRPIS